MRTKEKVTIYRLENSWGLGPYGCQACGTHDYGYGPSHPPPRDDGLENESFDYFKNKYPKTHNKNKIKFGFKSLEQLYDWFPAEIIGKFHSTHKIHIVTKEVREDLIKYGYKQIIFYDIRSPSNIIDYDYKIKFKRNLPFKEDINLLYNDKMLGFKTLTAALNIINEQ